MWVKYFSNDFRCTVFLQMNLLRQGTVNVFLVGPFKFDKNSQVEFDLWSVYQPSLKYKWHSSLSAA